MASSDESTGVFGSPRGGRPAGLGTMEVQVMPQGDKSSYSSKQRRQARHIEDSYRKRGASEKTAERAAWATVNKQDGGAKRKGSSSRSSKSKSSSGSHGRSSRKGSHSKSHSRSSR